MKRLFLMLLAALTLVACGKGGDDTPKPIELTGGTKATQTIYADETEKSEGIKFKATAAWTATVSDVTGRANDNDAWLRLSADSGGAGDVTLAISLDQNDTDKDRKAEILISCAGTTITITVEQKAINKPELEPTMRYIKKMTSKSSSAGVNRDEGVMIFEYDNQMRIAKIVNENTETDVDATTTYRSNVYFTYKDNTISLKSRDIEDGVEQEAEDVCDITLNLNGTVKQAIIIGRNMEDSSEESPSQIRSAASKAPIITKFKLICDYTYDVRGYLIKVVQRIEDEVTIDDYSVSWSNGNLAKIETTYDGITGSDEFRYSTIENKPCNWDLSLMSGEWSVDALNVVGELGLIGKRNKLLLSSITSVTSGSDNDDSYTHEYTYTLDKDGYVINIVEKGVGSSIYSETTTIEYVK